ncbi:FAD/NAD(P)-binding protein [Negadavirga shengliensis]|uniref:FAD/NAD(P)-binding protein n=1 Tax=Negadavirga shengliensis TaxID=1389218 RepID=A0ABV9SWL6_9BACT
MKNIAIIGGGACGVSVFIELFLKITSMDLTGKVSITWFEKNKDLGYGLAFGTREEGHLLNTQADLMGIYADEPDHFAEWLKVHGGKKREEVKGQGSEENAYTARILYGHYLAEQAKKYLKKSEKVGLRVNAIHAEIIDFDHTAAGYILKDHAGKQYECDFTILCLGTPKPNTYKEFLKYELYIDFPWPSEPIVRKLETDIGHVGVLGCSLSAIDTVMTLEDHGYKGKILLFSPDGLMPRVQPAGHNEVERKHLTIKNVHQYKRKFLKRINTKALFRMYRKDVEHNLGKKVNWKSLNRIGKDAFKLLKKDVEEAGTGGDALMNLAYSLRYDASKIWMGMSTDEKVKFMKWLGPHWAINRHGMPLYNAKRLLHLMENNTLKVVPFLQEVKYNGREGKFSIRCADREYQVDLLINATGSPSKLEEMNTELVGNILKKDIIKPYPAGGAVVNERTMQLMAKNAGDGLFALGHLVNGQLMDVNAIWFNVKTVKLLSQEVIFKIQQDAVS